MQGKKKISVKDQGADKPDSTNSSVEPELSEERKSQEPDELPDAEPQEKQEVEPPTGEPEVESSTEPSAVSAAEEVTAPEADSSESISPKVPKAPVHPTQATNFSPPDQDVAISHGSTSKMDIGQGMGQYKVPNVASLIEKVEGGERKKQDEVKRETNYTQENLLKYWNEYKDKKIEEGRDRQVNLMNQPMTIEDDVITVVLSNVLLQDMLDDFKTDLMEFLREKLENDMITITSVIKEEPQERKLYTNREKFDHLAEKNPALKELQTRLGLDPDY